MLCSEITELPRMLGHSASIVNNFRYLRFVFAACKFALELEIRTTLSMSIVHCVTITLYIAAGIVIVCQLAVEVSSLASFLYRTAFASCVLQESRNEHL